MAKQSVKTAVKAALRQEKNMLGVQPSGNSIGAATADSFANYAHKLGIGSDNPLSAGTYGFNPITRNRVLLEWIHRGSWLGGVAVDLVADDMTRAGIEYTTELKPDQQEKMDEEATLLGIWNAINEVIKWGRLYGGAIGVLLIDGQDPRTPLRMETVGPEQFKGVLVMDRWMVEPSLEDLVTEYGPSLGLPKYYRVQASAPALRGKSIHYTRVAFRIEGVQLPYQQRLTENLWGISVIERLYDRMIAFDSASTGAAQLVYKSYLRTLSIDGLREIVASGGKALDGLTAYVNMMSRFQGIEGVTMIDNKDTFEVQGHQAFSGLSDAIMQFGQQLSGALQIPLVRLFGQSPAGLNSTGESDLRMFYDHIKQQQMKVLFTGVHTIYRCIAASRGVKLPDNFSLAFRSLWELTDTDKGNIAKSVTDAVTTAHDSGLISDQVAMQELRQSSRTTGIYTNITEEIIEKADAEIQPPLDPMEMAGLMEGGNDETGQEGQAKQVEKSPGRRVRVQQPIAPSGKAGGGDS
jgi:phage-related protein (TIGR01555 family)